MAEREQIKPLASSSSPPRFNNDEEEATPGQLYLRRKRCIQYCGCLTAFLLILAVVILVLAFAVFNVKEPDIRLNGVTTLSFTSQEAQDSFKLLADVSVKNPNAFTYRFGNTTTIIYYDGIRIGDGTTPPGKAKARRTLRLNVTLGISISNEVLKSATSLMSDLSDDAVNISSYTRIDGKVKVLKLFKRTVVVEMNCTMEYNFTRGSAQGENCIRRVEL